MKTLQNYSLLFSLSALLLLCAGCQPPGPEEVTRTCLDRVVDKKYDKALAYCGPRFHEAVESHNWLISTHRSYVSDTAYTILSVEETSATNARAHVRITFTLRGRQDKRSNVYELRLTKRDKWYIDDLWYISAGGKPYRNVLSTLPASLF